jgi:isopenicillin N synthase-like dioxygenase
VTLTEGADQRPGRPHTPRPPATPSVVPLIDLTPWRSGDPSGKALIAEQVGRACEEIGFFGLVGHGVDHDIIAACYSAARAFFDLPLEEKQPVAAHKPDAIRGYVPLGRRAVAYSMDQESPPDLREIFSIGPIDVDRSDPYFGPERSGNHFAPNVWPSAPHGFHDALTAYYRALGSVSTELMDVFAAALGLPERFFVSFVDQAISMVELLNYPSLTEPPLPGQLRVGEHSDYGSLTILLHEDAPGSLQVLTRSGHWFDVPAVPGGFVVNIGDLMAQWTNDRWTSTVHRVVTPPPELAGDSRRLSIAYFHQPNYDAVISCLPGPSGNGAAKYPPETSGDHLSRKLQKSGSRQPASISKDGAVRG